MGEGRPPGLESVDPEIEAVKLLSRARLSSWGALATDVALLGLFLWGVDPTNLAYSFTVLGQSGVLVGLAAAGLLLPVLTMVWAGWLLQLLRRGDWKTARRWFPAIVVLGYLSLIGPGFYLHETLHLIDSSSRSGRGTSVPT